MAYRLEVRLGKGLELPEEPDSILSPGWPTLAVVSPVKEGYNRDGNAGPSSAPRKR